jgi:phosphatidylglycerol:prolipoprotein diacylglycerol transferase
MHPELFKIPFIGLPFNTYGLMLVIGFITAFYVIQYLGRDITSNPQLVINGALYTLLAGVIGARLFYVIHHYKNLDGSLLSIFAVWHGGLELYGAATLIVPVLYLYLRYHKLPIRKWLDVLVIGLTLVIMFGRIGCFMRGCCYGKPSELPWAIRFPYASDPYYSQIYPDQKRNRTEPYLKLPEDFFGYYENDKGETFYVLKPFEDLTDEQKEMVTHGQYRCLPVHPTQLYSSINGAILFVILYFFWRRSKHAEKSKNSKKLFTKPGSTFALMLILYGITRFILESLRDDNPFEFEGLTISQNIGIALIALGFVLMAIFQKMKSDSSRS